MLSLADAEEVFKNLKQLPEYHTTGEEMDRTKLSILNSFWAKDAPKLQSEFYPAGIKKDKDGQDVYGLGFILEILAEKSLLLGMSPNSEKGNLIAKELLGMLSSGERRYGIRGLQSNPDILWLKLVRNQIRIVGLGEVKTSLTAFRRKPEQVIRQELAVRKLITTLRAYRAEGAAEDIFEQKEVMIQEPPRRLVIVPADEKSKFSAYLPKGWECEEIEFSYEEILAIGAAIWPKFRLAKEADEVDGAVEIEIIKPKSLPDAFLKSFWEWGKSILWSVFRHDAEGLSHTFKNLLFFCVLTQRIPIEEEDIKLVFLQMEECHKLLNADIVTTSFELDAWEGRFLNKFASMREEGFFAEKMDKTELREQILLFLARLRKIRESFTPDHRIDLNWLEELDVTLL